MNIIEHIKRLSAKRMLTALVLVALGVLLFVLAEYDDSPGGMLIGVAVAIYGVWYVRRT